MIQIKKTALITAILRNQAHRLFGGAVRGGHRTKEWSDEQRNSHAAHIFNLIKPHVGDVNNKIGLEIGPGDNLDVCQLFLAEGCRRMHAVEKYATQVGRDPRINVIRSNIESIDLDEAIDFAYSNDVFEHVSDVGASMRTIFHALRPGGRFVNSIDLRGHNVFNHFHEPLNFLTCPDALYRLMFSHIETSNRVRRSEFVRLAQESGFTVVEETALAVASDSHLVQVKPHLLPTYAALAHDDLRVIQLLLILERPVISHSPSS